MDMLDNFKKLKSGKIEEVDPKMVYPLLRWCSGSPKDLKWCEEVNNLFFRIDRTLARDLLGLGIRDKNVFMKYPKALKVKMTKAEEVKRVILMEYYGWSKQELDRNPGAIEKAEWDIIATELGSDDKTRKVLGLPPVEKKAKKKVKEQ